MPKLHRNIYSKFSFALSKFSISHLTASFLTMTKYVPVWADGCREIFMNTTSWSPGNDGLNRTDGLVDLHGYPMYAFDNTTTWGITRETCYKYCGPSKLRQVGYVNVEWFSCLDLVFLFSKTQRSMATKSMKLIVPGVRFRNFCFGFH